MARVIHESSVVDVHAELADDVEIGPFCRVDAGVRIGAGTRLLGHVVVTGHTTIGASNVVHPFAVIGGTAQVRKGAAAGKRGGHALEVGDGNVFREGVTVNTSSADGATRIGSNNLFMAGSHVAHDAVVGSRCVVANGVQLAGHAALEDWVTFGGLSGVAQHVSVGQGAFVAAGAMCESDVPPFVIVQGDRARVRALNVVGLERRAVPRESVVALRRAFRSLWGPRTRSMEAVLATLDRSDAFVNALFEWLSDPVRRVRPAKRGTLAAR